MLSRLRHLGLQLLAALAAMFFVAPAAQPLGWAILQGLCAAALAIFMRLPGWQRLLHGLFVPALALMHQAALPSWVYLLGLALTFALGRNAVLERVPLYRSSAQAAERLAELLPGRAALLEAGCGDGRLAVWLCRLRPDLRVRALESAWGSWLLARARWWLARRPRRLEFSCRSFWRERGESTMRSMCFCPRSRWRASGASLWLRDGPAACWSAILSPFPMSNPMNASRWEALCKPNY
ncbi:class I SAM-dependent methyltransferase [Chromobacterium haemolyticum]|uniref:class I SAM-dependent methyltransferase n=1 Tax=Chromobacterium haemolyticum TaxID=394935 RepID=UPI001F074BCB|nr:class I SAM-dependent methyltransferase [Chromobacterium haemolyticum]